MKELNGNTKIVLAKVEERLKNHKEYMGIEFRQVNKNIHEIYNALGTQRKIITQNATFIKVGAGIFVIIVGVLIKHILG